MGDNAKTFSTLSLIFGVISIFFIGIIGSILAIVFASIAWEQYDDESPETRAGMVLGLVVLCVMGLIIMGTILTLFSYGVADPTTIGFIFGFGPAGYCSMATGGYPIPISPYGLY